MATASSMIYSALVMNGEKPIGGTLTTGEKDYYLDRLNAMLASWNLERLMCYTTLAENFPLSSLVGSYTIGSGGTFNTDRPTKLTDPCVILDAALTVVSHLRIIDMTAFANLDVVVQTAGSYPQYIAYDSDFDAGLATISLYPAPLAGLSLTINSWKQLQNFSTISVSTALPPGYQSAIESNFAMQAGVGFKPASADLIRLARETKAAIKTVNTPDAMMRLDYGIVGVGRARQSILTGG